CRNGKINN
ncbi:hypothetical protein ACTFIU_001769, partial [Dictyostelium citrinum]